MVDNSITVTGASTESVESNIAKWPVQVRATEKIQIDSFNKHKQSMKTIMDFLKANGIVDGINQEVYLGPASINERTNKNPKTNEIMRTKWMKY